MLKSTPKASFRTKKHEDSGASHAMHSVFLYLFVIATTVNLRITLFLIIIGEDNADENEKFTVNHTKCCL